MNQGTCLVCFSVTRVVDIRDTLMGNVYEVLSDNGIQAGSHPLCYICNAKLHQCKQLVKQINENNSVSQFQPDVRPVVQLCVFNAEDWSLPDNSVKTELHPDIKEESIRQEDVRLNPKNCAIETIIKIESNQSTLLKNNAIETGFVKGNNNNLPRIDVVMLGKFFALNNDFCSSEFRNVKTSMSSQDSYGDEAVGYVQVKRDSKLCTVKCKICPEHKVHARIYGCTLVLNEEEENIISVRCEDCVALQGGCKHAIAFLLWLHRRSEEPSCTSVECYWKKSKEWVVG